MSLEEIKHMILVILRIPLVFIIAVPCWFLAPLFILLGAKKAWENMTELFNKLAEGDE